MALLALPELLRVLLQQALGWVPLDFHLLDQWLAHMLPVQCRQQGPLALVSCIVAQRVKLVILQVEAVMVRSQAWLPDCVCFV